MNDPVQSVLGTLGGKGGLISNGDEQRILEGTCFHIDLENRDERLFSHNDQLAVHRD